MIVDEAIEAISEWTSHKIPKELISDSLNTFHDEFGKSFPDDAFYDARLNYFLEYFVLCTQLKEPLRITPLTLFRSQASHEEVERSGATALLERARHGLFRVLKVRSDETIIEDCFHGHRFCIKPKAGESVGFLRKNEIVQGFVFPLNQVGTTQTQAHLGKGLLIHPKDAFKPIRKKIKELKKTNSFNELEFLKWTAQRQILTHRYSKVNAKLIYAEKIYPEIPTHSSILA